MAHDRSLDLFANRFELTRHVVILINEDPPPERILYLHGLGGNGKSLLLRHLEKRACLRTDRWPDIHDTPDTELLDRLTEHGHQVPVARIDFGARPAGENRPQEAFSALFMLKRQLAYHRIPELFPRSEVDR
ncbi:hypothetical protein [Nonomuraea sp. NPDC048826]|uniref:hypothetical protein n=1 Tax=Nonomuraea sp. NPDC048826 TaxID=3364347 RepID=UPI0037229B7F